jgi:hypothetical protein
MHRGDGVFTPRERRTALLALVVAAIIAALGMVIQPLMRPSLGGAEAYVSAPAPGVIDATPLA